jgi:2-succinyl-6-hydroxy-2,4-cyclohexadiene-1-carboxylate synthase
MRIMPHANVNGVNIYYERHGESGEPLVLVHGYTGDVTDWRFQIPEFAKTHRVLIMDHRGHGKSDAPADRSCYTVETLADDVEALVAHAGFERFHLLGHSMGGAVVQEIALRSPQKLMSLTLHDTSYRFAATRSETVKKWIAARNAIAESQGMAAVANMPGVTNPPPHMPEERRIAEKERLSRMSVDGFIGCWGALESWQGVKERAHEITAPTLVIYGALDGPLVEASKRLAAIIPGATLVEIPEAGHSPQYERPALFNEALRVHLERNALAPSR